MSYNHAFHPIWDFVDAVSTVADDNRQKRLNNRSGALTKPKHHHHNNNSMFQVSPFFNEGGLTNWFGDFDNQMFSPAIDIYDTPEAYTVVANVAGASPDEIDLDFDSNTGELVVRGETSSTAHDKSLSPEDGDEYRKSYLKFSERRYGKFERRVTVPTDPKVNEDDITAAVDNGVLKITLPKVGPVPKKDKKKIKVTMNSEEDENKQSA